MKKKLAILILVAFASLVAWFFVAPRVRIDIAARSHDPSTMKLNHIKSMHKSSTSLPNKIQTGFIHLLDGGRVKFWFINRHVQPGKGLTRFDFEDGQTVYLSGAYCCEVLVSEDAVKNRESLLDYIAQADGSMP